MKNQFLKVRLEKLYVVKGPLGGFCTNRTSFSIRKAYVFEELGISILGL